MRLTSEGSQAKCFAARRSGTGHIGTLAALFVVLAGVGSAAAGEVTVAVAANFTAVAEDLAAKFKAQTGDEVKLSFGATGALYTQISQGAPFEILLSADDTRTKKAIEDGLGVPDTDFTYAIGTLVLYSIDPAIPASEEALKANQFEKIAIADPQAAPYGAAAVETIEKLGLTETLAPKIVTGESISQTLQFIESGNAQLGFVAQSQVINATGGTQWVVPAEDYEPIRQDAVLLKTGEDNPVAKAFIDYLKSPEAVTVIEAAGYAVPKP